LWFLLSLALVGKAQDTDFPKKHSIGEVEVDILSSYYGQDGDHSAVEGGSGTQELQDRVVSFTVNIPIDTVHILNISFSADAYSSASSDHIDGLGNNAVLSTASSKDVRTYGNLSYSRILKNGTTLTMGGGFSSEYDVVSGSGLLGISKESNDRNREVSLHVKGFYDNWKLILPTEFRYDEGQFNLPETRKTISADLSYAQVINTRVQAMVSYEVTYQKGLLSTPFHRIFFNDSEDPFERTRSIEKLPDNRLKHAFGTRISAFPASWLIGRFFYRYYFDSFGIRAQTFSTELPVKLNRFFSVYPFYRISQQSAADWFRPFGDHDVGQEYYTSDYDLSAFTSNKVGIGVRYSPPMGLWHYNGPIKNRTSLFKSVELRFGKYFRSDGLDAFIVSANLGFGF